jgi:hypothetical protein
MVAVGQELSGQLVLQIQVRLMAAMAEQVSHRLLAERLQLMPAEVEALVKAELLAGLVGQAVAGLGMALTLQTVLLPLQLLAVQILEVVVVAPARIMQADLKLVAQVLS